MNLNVEEVASTFVEKFRDILSDKDASHSFYMQELDGASSGNDLSKKWVESKGIDPSEYKGFDDENEDAEQVQMALITWQMSLGKPIENTVQVKCDVVDSIMEKINYEHLS
jgi:hypothetical protein